MRTFDHAMTKAAFERLRLLREPEKLPLPLDPALLRPFAVRFEGDTLCVSHEGRDLMYVGEFVKPSGARGVLTYPNNESVDGLMRRLLNRATRHLDECNRIMAAQKREEAARRAAEQEERQAKREEEERLNPPFAGLATEEGGVITVPKTVFDKAKRAKAEHEWTLNYDNYGRGPHLVRAYHRGRSLSFAYEERGEDVVLTPTPDNSMALDPELFVEELRRRAERITRVTDPDRIRRALEALPPAEYSCAMAVMKTPERGIPLQGLTVDVGDAAEFVANMDGVSLRIEKITVMDFRVRHRHDDPYVPKKDSDCVRRRMPAFFMRNLDVPEATEEQERRIGSIWAAFRADWLGIDRDLLRPEPAELPEEFEDDAVDGYWL